MKRKIKLNQIEVKRCVTELRNVHLVRGGASGFYLTIPGGLTDDETKTSSGDPSSPDPSPASQVKGC